MSAEDREEGYEVGYEVGYREGESSGSATWELILDEDSPMEVAQRLAKLCAIVEALAEAGPPVDRHDGDCQLCAAEGGLHTDLYKPEQHEPDCPWRMAKEALA